MRQSILAGGRGRRAVFAAITSVALSAGFAAQAQAGSVVYVHAGPAVGGFDFLEYNANFNIASILDFENNRLTVRSNTSTHQVALSDTGTIAVLPEWDALLDTSLLTLTQCRFQLLHGAVCTTRPPIPTEIVLNSGGGNDTVDSRDGAAEEINCGDGTDTLIADPLDTYSDCENVSVG